jgi:hypothetical protein
MSMNESKNNFCSAEISVENMHTFKTLRHFPGIATSLRNLEHIQQMQNGGGFEEVDKKKIKKKEKPRPVQLKSTHRLTALTHSSFGEINAMRNVRSGFIGQRAKERDEAALLRPKAIEKKTTPLERAELKLAKCSMKYDKRRMNDDLAGFHDGPGLTFDEFDVQLKRCLNIKLTKEECDALFEHMDKDGK